MVCVTLGLLCIVVVALHFSVTSGESDDEMWERFKLWFYSMDHNGDNVLSIADTMNCIPRHSSHAENQAVVRVKCTEFLPRWFESFVLRGHESVSEYQFIEIWKQLRSENVEKFETIIKRASKIFWIIIDMNNDEYITEDEDACLEDRRRSRSFISRAFYRYLLQGRPVENIRDIFCPWVY